MALNSFKFTKSWVNPTDFPTYEDNETQVRADMQVLYDELKDYINGVLLAGLTGTAGASNIGTSTGQSVEAAIVDRYTKLEADARTNIETKDLVKDWSIDLNTGVMTITKKDGTVTTFDTALEKVPAKFEVVEANGVWYLKITNVDGTSTQTDITNLMNIYNFSNSDTIAFTTTGADNVKGVTAVVRENSITLDMLALEAITQLQTWVNQAQASADKAKQSETNADTSADNALASANVATAKANDAQTYAESANTSRLSASASADEAEASANTAASKASAASNSATLALSYTKGGTGTRSGEDTDNAKYYMEQAKQAAGGDFATHTEVEAAKQEAIDTAVDTAVNQAVSTAVTTANRNATNYVTTHNDADDAHVNLFAQKADSLTYNNGQLRLQSAGTDIGLPVDIAVGGVINNFVSGFNNGSFTATTATNSFTIAGWSPEMAITLIQDNLFLVQGTDFAIDTAGLVTLQYNLAVGDTVHWIIMESSYDANDLSNKNIFVQTDSKGKVNGVASLDSDGKVPSSQLPNTVATTEYVDQAIGSAIGGSY